MTAKTQAPMKTETKPLNVDRSGLLQRKCDCGKSASLTGQCNECQSKQFTQQPGSIVQTVSAPVLHELIQPKLRVGEPGDKYEQEADRVADQVMRMPEPSTQRQMEPEEDEEEGMVQRQIAKQITPLVQRQVLREMEEEEKEVIQTKTIANQAAPSASTQESSEVPSTVHEVLRSPGQPLDAKTRAFFEPRFGYDFNQVRIYTSGKAAQSARAIDAMAYTAGRKIVFGAGKYVPETTEGKRLLAHELVHIQQQRGFTLSEPPSVIQRQPSSSVLPPDSSAGATSPGYEEAAHAPSLRVRIVAHASPRWRGALDAADADRRNLELSQRRADAVRIEVEELLADRFGSGASVNIDVTVEHQDGTVGTKAEARGSRDTLLESKGDRSDNARQRRRVDVIIESSQRISGSTEASRPLLTTTTASKFWHVSVDMSAGGSVGVAGSLLTLTLTNDLSGQTMQGMIWAIGGGPKASLGASASIWSDPTGFYTDALMDFSNFDGTWIRYTSAGVNLFLGYEKAYLSFVGLGNGAQSIDVGGWNTGTVGAGGSVVAGKLSLDGSYPPTRFPIRDTDITVIPYERTERGEDVHKVLFSTKSATLDDLEVTLLDSFLASVVASKR